MSIGQQDYYTDSISMLYSMKKCLVILLTNSYIANRIPL